MSIPNIIEVFHRVCASDEIDKTWKGFQRAVATTTFPNANETGYARLTVGEMESAFRFLILWTLFGKFFKEGDLGDSCEVEILRSLDTMIQQDRVMLTELICNHRRKQSLPLGERLDDAIQIGQNMLWMRPTSGAEE